MSDGRARYSFAELTTLAKGVKIVRKRNLKQLGTCSAKSSSRLNTKKVKGDNYLSRALLRSAFGRSED
jgi:hypothetical protein